MSIQKWIDTRDTSSDDGPSLFYDNNGWIRRRATECSEKYQRNMSHPPWPLQVNTSLYKYTVWLCEGLRSYQLLMCVKALHSKWQSKLDIFTCSIVLKIKKKEKNIKYCKYGSRRDASTLWTYQHAWKAVFCIFCPTSVWKTRNANLQDTLKCYASIYSFCFLFFLQTHCIYSSFRLDFPALTFLYIYSHTGIINSTWSRWWR